MRGPAWEEPTQSRMKVFHKIQAHFPAVTEEAAGGTGKGVPKKWKCANRFERGNSIAALYEKLSYINRIYKRSIKKP